MDSRSVILDSPFARRLERTGTGRPYGNGLDTTSSRILKMQGWLADPDSHLSKPGCRESDRPPELLKSSLCVDRRRDANCSRSRDPRPTSFRFNGIDGNGQLPSAD